MKKILLLFLSALVSFQLYAQHVSDVSFFQEGDMVHIRYRLVTHGKADVSVYMSDDGGRTFGPALKYVSGDVGIGVTSGYNHIIWDPLAERDGVYGDEIVFRIVAEKSATAVTQPSVKEKKPKRLPLTLNAGMYYSFGLSSEDDDDDDFGDKNGGLGLRLSMYRRFGGYADIAFSLGHDDADDYSIISTITAGAVLRTVDWLVFSVGMGYSANAVYGKGFMAEAGLSLTLLKIFSVDAGVFTVNFANAGLKIGIGLTF